MLLVLGAAQVARAASPVMVYPSAATIPQRLLRISLIFRSPQRESIAYSAEIRNEDGSVVSHPFADPPLWSADGKTLTLLLDPSRQKLGLAAHQHDGFVLQAGRRAQLFLGRRWLKTWHVITGSCPGLDPAHWLVLPVRSGSKDTLAVRFAGPIDRLSQNYLAIAAFDGTRVAGTSRLGNAERTWSFVPAVAWRRGDRLAVHPRLENPCGDELGEPFEHAPGSGLASNRETTFVPLDVVER